MSKRPPKRKAKVAGDRPINRLSEADKALVLAKVKEFLQYVNNKRG